MPGHFTHIYTARRVADLLASGKFTDWPKHSDSHTRAAAHYRPEFLRQGDAGLGKVHRDRCDWP
ncbi:MAG: hypothetical protein HY033_04135 [Ignavibacteriae bacterium]|nr:hypothetical protein [Ignavibacteria bacterium]MBI3364077.1 hypothetical protein [Ignavibacteriota bacterium]